MSKHTIVCSEDDVARFIYENSKMGKDKPKHAAFMPPKKKTDVSVSITTGLSEDTIWRLAKPRNGKMVKARASLSVQDVEKVAPLIVARDDKPRYHAHISCWPSENSRQIALAKDLAKMSELVKNKE